MNCKPELIETYRYCTEVANELETRWQSKWSADSLNVIGNPGDAHFDTSKPKFYCLDMFPYPSGAGLHVGHPVGYIGSDIISRFKRLQGYNVLHPMGWDAFGLPAEQYAIETGIHPALTTRKAIDTFRGQLQRIGFSYDWSREFATIDPDYYKWTQWIWLKAYGAWFDPELKKARPITLLIEGLNSGTLKTAKDDWHNLSEKEKTLYINNQRLAYLGEQVVNWCPKLGTVLANEEVIDGLSERGGFPVVRRPLRQWMFRITSFADRLLEDLEGLDWPQSTLRMQSEWIGRSEGADIDFPIDGTENAICVYTTRPDTLFGVSFIVLAPEHPIVSKLIASPPENCDGIALAEYVTQARNRADVDRMADAKSKSGVFSGLNAINPATGKCIPIWIADYVLMGYGHGAIMAVPAHDQRDHAFAQAHDIKIIEVVKPLTDEKTDGCFSGKGVAINSSSEHLSIEGLESDEASQKVIAWLVEKNIGVAKINYRLRDWLFSRQRYWGEPFPIVFDEDGNHYPISETHLPVVLPVLEDYTPTESEDPTPLLGKATDWLNTTAGEAGVDPEILPPDTPVTREANTMPGWAGSCWYQIRYCSPHCSDRFVTSDAEKYWTGNGIDLYIGGAEHAVLHLLYSRFWHKMLFDLGEVSCNEPFQKLFHQGLLTSFSFQRKNKSLVPSDQVEEQNGTFIETATGEEVQRVIAKMSKSLKNVVSPDDVIAEYGADTLRLYEMYMGPLEASAPWSTRDIVGVHRFLQRVWRLCSDEHTGEIRASLQDDPDETVDRALATTIAKVTDDIPKLAYNTAIASMIEFVNTSTSSNKLTACQLNQFVRILAPFAPHIAQEIYTKIGGEGFIAVAEWPTFDPEKLVADVIELPVQIMGKVRGRVSVSANASDEEVEKAALSDPNISALLETLSIRKIIIVPNKIINIVAN
jgi:leucyl-tRNA synthetase